MNSRRSMLHRQQHHCPYRTRYLNLQRIGSTYVLPGRRESSIPREKVLEAEPLLLRIDAIGAGARMIEIRER
jgi:hypothetical protein